MSSAEMASTSIMASDSSDTKVPEDPMSPPQSEIQPLPAESFPEIQAMSPPENLESAAVTSLTHSASISIGASATPPAATDPLLAWRSEPMGPSLAEAHATVEVPENKGCCRTFLAFVGPGLLVAVGYMDPGNWATDLAGGSKFGYTLLFVILLSNFLAMILQHLALKLGVVAGRDLAQACRDHYTPRVSFALWIICEIAIAACDLAEVIGSAIALDLLFGIPLVAGCLITALDALLVLFLEQKNFRLLEVLVATLMLVIFVCFGIEMALSGPDMSDVAMGLLPSGTIVTNSEALYISIGILGATVMPHNLYLHSAVVQTRAYARDQAGRRQAVKYGTVDSTVSLFFAFFVNAAILILAGAVFHGTPNQDVSDLEEAHKLLSPLLGKSAASTLFALALLMSGQNSTITGTLAGQIVMEGFIQLRLKPWVRRLITRCIAIVPAVIVAAIAGSQGVSQLLVLSQVILSLQLPFAIIPLVTFTNSKAKMGEFVNSRVLSVVAILICVIITGLNLYLVVDVISGLFE